MISSAEEPRPGELLPEERRYVIDPILLSEAKFEIVKGLIGTAILQPERKEEITHRIACLIDQASKVDSMTGLKNSGGLKEDLEMALGIAKRTKTPLAVLFIDGDRFKEVNDELTHEVGDNLIGAFSNGIKKSLKRNTDMVARLEEVGDANKNEQNGEHSVARKGGDEFVVILPGTDAEGARIVITRLEEDISTTADAEIPTYREHFKRRPSATIGIAVFDPKQDQDTTWKKLLKEANIDMQRKKRQKGVAR